MRANSSRNVNQDRIADDPELLRQWIHHRRAELALAHWALGPDPARFLLNPDSPRTVRARIEGLAAGLPGLDQHWMPLRRPRHAERPA